MSEKTRNKIIVIGFVSILFIFFIANIVKKDEQISLTERRKLAQFPTITFKNISSGKASEDFDKYTVDQFIFRDSFRSIKSFWSKNLYRQKDNNGLFLKDGSIYKIEYPLNKENVKSSAEKIKSVCDKYLKNNNVYYSIIPDKNYYLQSDYLKIDVNEMQEIMREIIPNVNYIDITKDLNLEDYYRTDLHWKQENLENVINTINDEMNIESKINTIKNEMNSENITNTIKSKMNLKEAVNDYEIVNLGDFYGAYYGQLGMKVEPDTINILINDTIQNSIVNNYEKNSTQKVYDIEKWKSSSDKYDVYLSGATPIIEIETNKEIENENSSSNKELILFRDSFGSSIAPLLLDNYSKITLIDLRYVSSKILDNYVDFKNQDVLFLYSALILNQNVFK